LDSEEIKPVNPKGNQSWIFIEKTDAKAEAPILWPPDVNSNVKMTEKAWLIMYMRKHFFYPLTAPKSSVVWGGELDQLHSTNGSY